MSLAVKRAYRSSLREAQAARTRRRILAAARALFVQRGFEATSIAAIALKAKVAVPTVYAIFGSKRGILNELYEQVAAKTRQLAGVENVWSMSDVHEQIRRLAKFQRLHGETGGDVLEMARSASAIDPDAAAIWHEREQARRERSVGFARSLQRRGLLRPGLDVATAADVIWFISDPIVYPTFVKRCGWTPRKFERWFGDVLARLVLASEQLREPARRKRRRPDGARATAESAPLAD
jgi:AcrR family transcriptional regulator